MVSVCIDAVRMRDCYGGRLYLFRVVRAAVTHLDVVLVEDFPRLWSSKVCLSTSARNLSPMLVLVFLLKGGLYQRILLHCRFFRLLLLVGSYRV